MKAKTSNLAWGWLQVNVFKLGRESVLSSADDMSPRRDSVILSTLLVNASTVPPSILLVDTSTMSPSFLLLATSTVLPSVLLFSFGVLKLIDITASARFTPRLPIFFSPILLLTVW